ncbi:MAG TPA: hypothetical protein VGH33_06190 [Isosphaeraceae bacterium]
MALGFLGTSADAGAKDVAPPLPAMSPAPAPPNAPAFAVLVLSNGRLLQGNVTESASGDTYELRMKGGLIPVPKRDVAHRYRSLDELYRDKAARLPANDPDERMKLALWCLEQHMEGPAREQLRSVLAINPSDRRAQRMITSIDANAARAAARDSEVRVAGAEVVEPVQRGAMPLPRSRGSAGRGVERPVIFSLPPDIAMKRFAEFAWEVHPILQASCASCHNDAYQGEYRLITGQSRRDWTADVVRANLDATLRYVRADDPTHSDLVAYASNPHGPSPRAVFHGANDRRQQRLVAWLRLLRPADGATPESPTSVAMPSALPVPDGFGADRLPAPRATPMPAPPALSGAIDGSAFGARNYSQHYDMDAVAPGVPAGVRFDAPALPGVPRPQAPPLPGVAASAVPAASGAAKLPELPPGTPVPPPDDVIPPTNRPKKSAKLDPALLEQLLKSRQQAQP